MIITQLTGDRLDGRTPVESAAVQARWYKAFRHPRQRSDGAEVVHRAHDAAVPEGIRDKHSHAFASSSCAYSWMFACPNSAGAGHRHHPGNLWWTARRDAQLGSGPNGRALRRSGRVPTHLAREARPCQDGRYWSYKRLGHTKES